MELMDCEKLKQLTIMLLIACVIFGIINMSLLLNNWRNISSISDIIGQWETEVVEIYEYEEIGD